jgi:hypothetical protein
MSATIPVGTIVSSMLDYPQFIEASTHLGHPLPKTPVPPAPKIDPHMTVWVPADGRAVNGSAYHQLTGRTNVPDLRGTFLRAINNFDPQWTTPPENRSQLDPDQGRIPGSYQPDKLGDHSHSYTWREPSGGGGGSEDSGDHGLDTKPGTTGGAGGPETRPKNYGVTYYVCIN